jgi:bifunctional non-homologous end joining protein LigD
VSRGEELARSLGARAGSVDASRVVPMLCEREEAAARVLDRPGWLFELKLDGVRIVAGKDRERTRLFYRKLRDATESYAEIADAVRSLDEERVVLDGEIVAFDEQGRPDFQRLGHRIQTGAARRSLRTTSFVPVVYVVFDVLAVGGYDVRAFPLEARKEILARIVPEEGAANGLVRLHPTFASGVELFRLCREHRLEGVVAKKLGSAYRSGERTTDWLKIKCERDAEFVVIGWTEGESDRARLGALDLGAYEGDRLVFRGRVGSGLHGGIIDALLERLLVLEVPSPVAEGKYSPKPKRHHCRPEIVVSVRYGGFSLDPTGARFLRFPVFRGIRPDVGPRDCTAAPEDRLEDPPPGEPAEPVGAAEPVRRIHVTAPAQVVFACGTTKADLCTYFEAVAQALLRGAARRACALVRPDGTALWPPPRWMPKFVRTATLKNGARELRGYVIDSVDALLFAVEAASPCLHHGALSEDRAAAADFVALRLAGAPRAGLVAAARATRAIADEIGLPSVAVAAGARAIEVRIGIGTAPAVAAGPLATLLAHLATAELGAAADVRIASAEPARAALAPCPAAGDEPLVVAVPLGWDELERVDIAALGLDAAVERAGEDLLGAIAPARVTVDIAAVMAALERAVARRER